MDRNAGVTRQGDRAIPGDANLREQDHAPDDECRCHYGTLVERFIPVPPSPAAGRSGRVPGPAAMLAASRRLAHPGGLALPIQGPVVAITPGAGVAAPAVPG